MALYETFTRCVFRAKEQSIKLRITIRIQDPDYDSDHMDWW